ncbi:MAG: DUF1552 domain-containing protein [Planctomycetota bacterium]
MSTPTSPLTRRGALKAAGVSLALPWLESATRVAGAATPAGAASAAPPTRLAFMFFANGVYLDSWKMDGHGHDAELSRTLAPLERHRGDFTVFDGFAHMNAEALGDGGGDHARNASCFLTGAHPVKTSGRGMKVGQSFDQFLADRLTLPTQERTLELAAEPNRVGGRCDSGYGCAYSNSISWRTPTRANPTEHNPRAIFERLFGGAGDSARLERLARRQSILDFVAADARRLTGRLARDDRGRLEEYLTSVRDVEKRLDRLADTRDLDPELDLDAADFDDEPPTHTERIDAVYDLLALAFRTDRTRIATYMLGKAGSGVRYREVGVARGHHDASHYGTDKHKIAAMKAIDHLLVDRFSVFLDTLKATPDGPDGSSLLDNTVLLYGSGISDSNKHDHDDLPIVVAGGGARLRHATHTAVAKDTPLCDLLLTLGEAAGATGLDRFGDSTGKVSGLLT